MVDKTLKEQGPGKRRGNLAGCVGVLWLFSLILVLLWFLSSKKKSAKAASNPDPSRGQKFSEVKFKNKEAVVFQMQPWRAKF